MTQEQNETIINKDTPVDFYEVFKETIIFEDSELEEEIGRQIEIEKAISAAGGAAFEETLKNELSRMKAKKAIMESALLLSAAISIAEDKDFEAFTDRLLVESEQDDKTALKIRANLLLEEPSETRNLIKEMLVEQNKDDVKAQKKAKIQFETRVDKFVDEFRKKYSI